MKFPGKRKSKHYFPVDARDPLLQQIQPENETSAAWVVGIDQTLVDIEAKVDDAFVARYGLSAGHSLVIEDDVAEALYQELVRENLITHQFAGGTIGNTMHNYSVLADDRSVLLGVMCSNIEIGGYAYRYLCNTSSRTDLNYLQGVDGPIGRCFTLISDSGERTFAISPGHMNKLRAESIPEEVIAGASALVLTSYLVRCKPGEPMPEATMKAIEYAKKYNVPVVLTLGTKFVIADNPEWWQAFLKEHVSILAMNEEEARKTFQRIATTCGTFLKFTPELLGWLHKDELVTDAVKSRTAALLKQPQGRFASELRMTACKLAREAGIKLIDPVQVEKPKGWLSRLLQG
jgi:inosine kinase